MIDRKRSIESCMRGNPRKPLFGGNMFLLFLAFVSCNVLFASPEYGIDSDGVYYVDVPSGETVELNSALFDVSAANTTGAPFAKRGEGTLKAGDAMAGFTGEIRVENGVYDILNTNGTGAVSGLTSVSNGATLKITGGDFGFGKPCQNEKFHICGDGYKNQGAIFTYRNQTKISFLTLVGDAKICGKSTVLNEWGGSVNLNGKKLTIALEHLTYNVSFAYGRITAPGNICVQGGGIHFDQMISVGDSGCEVELRIKNGGVLYTYGAYQYNNNGLKLPWRLVLEDGAIVKNARQNIVWTSSAVVDGTVSVVRQEDAWGLWFKGITFDGKVSGNGMFDVKDGQFVSLTNPENDFTGSFMLNGKNEFTNSLLKVVGSALPAESSGVALNYGKVEINGAVGSFGVVTNRFGLPRIQCTSHGSVICDETMMGSGNKHFVKEIVKSGDGALTLVGPLCVTGRTEVTEGTLRIGSRPPSVQTGLKCYFYDFVHSPYYDGTSGNNGSWKYVTDLSTEPFTRNVGWMQLAGDSEQWNNTDTIEVAYQGIDPNGVSLAYEPWPVKFLDVIYKGYLWVDGENEVIWNFAANVFHRCVLMVDGAPVITNKDVERSGIGDRFTVSTPVTLTPGRHEFLLYMASAGNAAKYGPGFYTTEGPESADYWEQNMGIAYNPNSAAAESISSNSTDYLKFTASQFSPTPNRDKAEIDATLYRASFSGGMKFATGTILDVGDVAPYSSMTIADLEGAMTITNGIVVLSGNWTVDAAEINAGGIILTGDASLIFADDATLSVTNGRLIKDKGRDGMPIVTCAGTGTVTGMPTILMDEDRWKVYVNGRNLNIHRPIGLTITFR